MLWIEIKKWAKSQGYDTIKDKDDNKYYWAKLGIDDPTASGVAPSVSKLARAIFNHITNNKWVDYQTEYQTKLDESQEHIDMNNYATG